LVDKVNLGHFTMNGLRIMNGGSGQWKRLHSRMGHALDDDDDFTMLFA